MTSNRPGSGNLGSNLLLNKRNAPAIKSPSERARAMVAERPHLAAPNSFPQNPRRGAPGGGIAARRTRPPPSLNDMQPPPSLSGMDGARAAGLGLGRPTQLPRKPNPAFDNPFANFSKIIDPSGKLNFKGKAILHAKGVNFSSGASFSINMSELELQEELGRGNYGTVKKVLHKPTNVEMAMKEIRLQLENSGLQSILMELDILHNSAICPQIVEFYGAFFIESCVYYCMEFMDAGSLDKLVNFPLGLTVKRTKASLPSDEKNPTEEEEEELVWEGVPEDVLAQIAGDMVRGLKFLKEQFEVMHRDVKPTNVLVNKKGQIKLCDFGVSGQLNQSLAKTNIGCQSYMAPERIYAESQSNEGSYTVSADVWSLGLSIIETGIGRYPYPPETYENVFAQLTAIVNGDPPELPDRYSEPARAWVQRCVAKRAEDRATYKELLEHPFLATERKVDMGGWVKNVLDFRDAKLAADKSPRASSGSMAALASQMNGVALGDVPNPAVEESYSAPATVGLDTVQEAPL